jgi:hypothetical protein
MEKRELKDEYWTRFHQNTEPPDRRAKDRRKNHSRGYTYISIVGWMCRREKKRSTNENYE